MTQLEARKIIMAATQAAMQAFRAEHPLTAYPTESYLDAQRDYINAEIIRTIPEDVRKAAI